MSWQRYITSSAIGLADALQIVEEGSWAEAVGSAIIKLGCSLLDQELLTPVPPVVSLYVTIASMNIPAMEAS